MSNVGPLVSIITPTYNHEAFIGPCIESVLAQSYPHWEMIVVDDGSTDATRDVVEQYDDPRICLIAQENKGIMRLAETYNAALESARGELIAILEGDDYWPPYKLELQTPSFADEAVVLSSGFAALMAADGCVGITPVPPPPTEDALNNPIGRAAKIMMDPSKLTYTFPVSTMIRRTALERIGGFIQPEYLPLVDYPTFLRLTTTGQFCFQALVLGFWRRHDESTTRSKFPLILDGAHRYAAEFIERHRGEVDLSDVELNELSRMWQSFQALRCTMRGRILASKGMYGKATRAFRETSVFQRSLSNRIATSISIALSTIHLPCEWLYRLMGRPSIEQISQLRWGDVLVAESDLDRPRNAHRWHFGKG